ncbi:hypothetical protein GCM10022287_05750 [Gryllotalpicola koreensis]|uniref:Uncharacterized protein n=1 Tax=Gryllotalpicola koreensis TaxID=993086 RepID=A0ABP7ZSN0_9MICO
MTGCSQPINCTGPRRVVQTEGGTLSQNKRTILATHSRTATQDTPTPARSMPRWGFVHRLQVHYRGTHSYPQARPVSPTGPAFSCDAEVDNAVHNYRGTRGLT